jgi:rubrerythrin
MTIRFSADEVFQMAEQIEENGARYYRKAAELHKGKAGIDTLLKLAEIDDRHQETFATLRKTLADQMREETAFDPYAEATLYLNQMADTHGGEGTVALTDSLTGEESVADVLRTAIELEKNSILFYLGLREMVPEKLGRSRVDEIIEEEKDHVVVLTSELRSLPASGA